MTNKIIFITGRKGSGKTTLANQIANDYYLAGRRVICIAPMAGLDLSGAPTVFNKAEMLSDKTDGRSFVLQPADDSTALLGIEFGYRLGNTVIVVDEVDLYADCRSPQPLLLQIIRYGRHRAVSLIGISQRPANVVRDMTAQSDFIVMFQSTENRDLQYLADRIGSDNAEAVRQLPQFQFLVYSAYAGGIVTDYDLIG